MKRYLYCLALIMSAILVQVSAQTSGPSYDQKTPPAFEWGTGKMNAQKQGTPTTGDHEIIANINVTVDNVAERLISETTDKSITDVTEDILEAVNSNNTGLTELAVLLKDASGTTSIFDKVNNIDGRLIYTPEGATESVDITELLAQTKKAIEEKAEIIDGRLIYTLEGATESVDITELLAQTKKAIEEKAEIIDGRLIYTPEGATESVDITELVAKLDVTLNTVATQIIASMPSMSTVDSQINYLASEAEKLQVATLTSIIGNINSNIEGLRWTEFRHANSVKSEDDVATDTVVSLLREIKNKEAGGEVELSETNDLISSNTEKIDSLLTAVNYSNGSDTFSVADIVYDISESVKNLDFSGSMSIDISETNSLITSNTEKLVATVTYTVPGMGDGSSDTAEVQSISQILARQFGDMINNSSYDYDDESGEFYESYSVPPVCRFLCDMENLLYKILDVYLTCEITKDGRTKTVSALFSDNLIEESEGSDSFSSTIGIADELISREPIQIAATYSRSLTVADGLFTDKDGNPTHVLGRILNAVENGGSTSSSSSGSADLSKLERAVGVVLNEGSDGDKGEPPEVDIKLVDMFYDKGTGIIDFSGDDSLNEGISMYDMTKAGLIGQDENGNTVPLIKEMLGVSYSVDSGMPKMADVVFSIDSKIPQNAIASITQETFSSRINLDNLILKMETLNTRVATLTNELITLPSKGMGITAGIAIGTSAVEFGGSAYPSKALQGWHRQFVEIISDEGDDGEFKIAFDASGDTRNVKGRILLNIDKSQHVWISADSSSTVTVTEGWR